MRSWLTAVAATALGGAVAVACAQKSAEPSPVRNDNLGVTNTQKPADNTAVNARDESMKTVTPMDQGNDSTDLAITQSIRKAIMSDSSLSADAKNCKVITSGQKVVLRGPVKSDAERQDIEGKARTTPNVESVEDELEVAP